MDPIRYSIEKPVTVIVGVIFVLLFGFIGLKKLPYQLTPSVTEPTISITTVWPGATPYEVERDIIEEQEEVLKGLPGLVEMESTSRDGMGEITLRFRIGTDVDDALLRVSNKLNEVRSYPENVEKPVINATGAATSPVIWTVLQTLPGNPRPVDTYRTFFENEVRQYIERVEGVADLFIGGGVEEELHVVVDPEKLAARKLTMTDVVSALQSENLNISAGTMDVGRRSFRIRTVGDAESPEELERIVLYSDGHRKVLLRDVAEVRIGYEKRNAAMFLNGEDGIAVGIKPEPGANVLSLTDRVEKVVRHLNETILKDAGITLTWVYDQRPYIRGAIGLVRKNIFIGGFLAIAVLLIFLRSVSSTLVVSTAIPISVIGTFLFMALFGRNINVVSLAGISFAVGMLVDNAIVVLENIDRHRKMGKGPFEASYEGAREVWGAVLASTLTTVAVFLPVVFIEEEAGQLFKDIAIAVTFAVSLSLFVSVSVIPSFSRQLYSLARGKPARSVSPLVSLGNRLVERVMSLLRFALKNTWTKAGTVLILTLFSVVSVLLLFPKMEYLPQGNRNLVISILIPPPGLSYAERADIGKKIFRELEPYMGKDRDGFPGIQRVFYVGADRIMLLGARSIHEQRAGELVPLFSRIVNSIPGVFGVSSQAGIFQTRLGRGRTIDLDVSGDDLERVVQTAGAAFGMIRKAIPGSQVRPIPSLELSYPEVRSIPLREKLKAAGLTTRDIGIVLDILNDGRKVGEFRKRGSRKIDLVVMTRETRYDSPEALQVAQVVTPSGNLVPLSSLVRFEKGAGLTEIRHLERKRTITLQITPPASIPLQRAMEIVQERVVTPLEKSGSATGVTFSMSGAADKLTEMRKALQWNFLLAAVITYLLMSSLFANFVYPFIIMFTVPLAGAGGFIGLRLVDLLIHPQQLDVLTMLGFIILVGIVVNNAILIVHQALNNVRLGGMEESEAILDSVRTRLRPIYMSATTSVFGMLPLVVAPGPGSELYRGLGSVILGGLALSTVFTIFVIPCLLSFAIGMERRRTILKHVESAG
ncbi:MAG: efflux RND transporter permease subunit [Deltaproteobacteria bacterium]|nr:MAG: efflux RND transporter permease subunit [Deltaproteobacteria bacterium]